jgi:hypothetical protein
MKGSIVPPSIRSLGSSDYEIGEVHCSYIPLCQPTDAEHGADGNEHSLINNSAHASLIEQNGQLRRPPIGSIPTSFGGRNTQVMRK